jgi:ElaB/YqjD/DUF883 family membrane-anchored ribosome-binding protein
METYYGGIEQAHSRLARDRVLADLKTLARDSEDLLKATLHDASDKTTEARSRVTLALERARATISELQEQAAIAARTVAKRSDAFICRHPLQLVGVAFGLGLLIGVLAVRGGRQQAELD